MSKDRKSPSLSQMGPDSIKHKVSAEKTTDPIFYRIRLVNSKKKKKDGRSWCFVFAFLQFSLQDNGSAKYFQGAMHTSNMGEKVAQVSHDFQWDFPRSSRWSDFNLENTRWAKVSSLRDGANLRANLGTFGRGGGTFSLDQFVFRLLTTSRYLGGLFLGGEKKNSDPEKKNFFAFAFFDFSPSFFFFLLLSFLNSWHEAAKISFLEKTFDSFGRNFCIG